MRRRGAPKKPLLSYALPLGISFAVIVLGVMLVNLFTNLQHMNAEQERRSPIASFNVETDNVSLLLSGKESRLYPGWNNISLSNDEGLKTAADARVHMQLQNGDYARIDSFTTIYAKRGDEKDFFLGLDRGALWYRADTKATPESTGTVKTRFLQLTIQNPVTFLLESREGTQQLAVVSGELRVNIINETGKAQKTFVLEKGQSITFAGADIASIGNMTETALIVSTPDSVLKSDWYAWNMAEDSKISNFETTPSNEDINSNINGGELNSNSNIDTDMINRNESNEPMAVTSFKDRDEIRTDTFMVRGTYDPQIVTQIAVNSKKATLQKTTWSVANVSLPREGTNSIRVSYVTADGAGISLPELTVIRDTTPPATPTLSSTFRTTMTDPEEYLEGSVTKEIVKVAVNGYVLRKFVPNSGEWQYIMTAGYNIKEGKNSFEVIAFDKAGNPSRPLEVTAVYTGKGGLTATGSTLNTNR